MQDFNDIILGNILGGNDEFEWSIDTISHIRPVDISVDNVEETITPHRLKQIQDEEEKNSQEYFQNANFTVTPLEVSCDLVFGEISVTGCATLNSCSTV